MSIHARIKARRLQLGLSQEQLAKEVGVSYQAVQQWENEPDPDDPKVISTAPQRSRMPDVVRVLQTTEMFLREGRDSAGGDLDPNEQQLIAMYRSVDADWRDFILQQTNEVYSRANKGKPPSVGDPFSGKKPPKPKKRS